MAVAHVMTLQVHFGCVTAQLTSGESEVNIDTLPAAVRQTSAVVTYCGPNGPVCCSGLGGFDVRLVFEFLAKGEINAGWLWLFAFKGGIQQRMRMGRAIRASAAGALLLSTFAFGGCSTSIADLPVVGTPADAPERSKETGNYLPVHDIPPDREEAALPPDEQARILRELAAARDRQASAASAANGSSK